MNPQLRRLILDFGPLLILFGVNKLAGIFAATAAFMVAITVTLAIGYALEKKLSPMPLFTAVLVLVFGGLTLWLKDATFLKVKVTIIYSFFGVMLLGGMMTGRLYLKYVFATAFELDDAGWRKLTLRWGIFCLALAALNEAVWRQTSTDTWIAFKVWGILPLTLIFTVAQLPLMLRHAQDEKTPD
jgi:intracellular septation protein